jgi:two-component system alkaline phosphatase synthesis response regulator PhoP
MSKKILVADDDPHIVEMVKSRLQANGYEVINASDGQEALDKALNHKPDLIIVDILMPNMDGYTFVKEARASEGIKNIPIIILTAKDKMKDLFEIEGVKDYVVKPFKSEELLEKVAKYFNV